MKKLGKYEVLEELGSGAMGVVYKARDPIINRLVALKKIKANVADSPTLLERFYREAQSAGSLQHPNIVTIYEMGEEEGTPFIAMQLVDGQNLGNLIAQRAPIPLSLKLVYAVEACRAFAYAHKQGIVHRDIKPGNIMVSKEGAVKVVDFGIARILENSKTQTGMLIGTFAYMPPEVFNGEHADERSDIFSFGVLLYELFAYTRPFPGDIPASLMQSICLKEPIPLREVAPECPPELEAVIHRTLLKSVTERTQTMEDLLLELDPICKGLQAQTSADLVAQARTLVQEREFAHARELLVQALQVDFSNRAARALLDEVNANLKRILIRPRVEKHVNAGRAFLGEGKIQEAQLEAENALKLDSSFEPAEELLRQVQQEIGRAKLISEWLEASGARLAEGLPEEAEAFLAKIQEIDPANRQATKLQQQVLEEKARRQRRLHLLETMQQARALWMQQKYEDCIGLLTSLQQEFGDEEEVQKFLITAREDRAELQKRQTLDRARTLSAAGSFDECKSLLADLSGQFPNDEEVLNLLEQVQRDEAEQRKLDGLKEARNLLAARRYEDCLQLLASLNNEFPQEDDILGLVEAVREDQEAEQKEQGLKEARSLLASQRYDECREFLTRLQGQFPSESEIPRLLDAVLEEQTEQHRLQGLSEVQKLLSSKQYADSLDLLNKLKAQFPNDKEIPRLAEAVQKDQAEQRRLDGLSEARKLLSSRQYAESLDLLTKLKTQFPDDKEIPALAEAVQRDQAEQRRLEGLAEARKLLSSRQYAESLALLGELKTQFPDDKEIPALAEAVQRDQAEQRRLEGLSEARKLLSSRQYAESLDLLSKLKTQFPDDKDIPALAEAVQRDQAEQRRLEGLSGAQKLLSSKQYAESLALLGELKRQFPDDKEIPRLAESVQKDQAEQQKLQGLAEARKLRASRQYSEALAVLAGLKAQFSDDKEILKLGEAIQKDQAEQLRSEGLAKARKFLASRQYTESLAVLSDLNAQFPDDKDIPALAEAVQRDQAEQRRLEGLSEAQKLLSSKQYAESLALLGELKRQFPNDKEIPRLAESVQKDQAEQQKLQGLAEARKLRASRQYSEALAVLAGLKAQFSDDKEILKLGEAIQKDQAEQLRSEGLAKARKFLASRQYTESLAVLSDLNTQFPGDKEILRLAEAVQRDQAEQQKLQGLANARKLRASKQYSESIALLNELKGRFPEDKEVSKLVEGIRRDQADQKKLQGLSEARNLLASRRLEDSFALLQGLNKDFPQDDDIIRLLTNVEQERVEQQRQQRFAEARALLGSQRFGEALGVLDPLLAANAKDTGVMKLQALILEEQEKVARSARLANELQALKKLVSDESYETVIARAEGLLREFANDADLVRIRNFARIRKEHVEREKRLTGIVDEVQKLIASNQLAEAIEGARHGLESFEGNSDLRRLLEQAEALRKKEFTRLQIQQRVREIKTKIHREEYSDAVRLAQDALTTLGPDTDLTQLLTVAQVESHARDKKRDQSRKLENVRALLDLGDLEGATLLLDDTIKREWLETADPRVQTLSKEIAEAIGARERTHATATPDTATKEYAFLEGPPQIVAPQEEGTVVEQAAQVSSVSEPASPSFQSGVTAEPEIAPVPAAQEVEITESVPAPEPKPAPLHIEVHASFWKRRFSLVVELLGVILAVSAGAYFVHRSKPAQNVSQDTSQRRANEPAKNLPETQQRELINAADKAIGQGDFEAAKSTLEQAKNINGPLNSAVGEKLGDVEKAINNAATAAVLKQEETLWSQATAYLDNGKFSESQQAFRAILKLPQDGRRKAEAQQYLNEVIPRRQHEEQLFAQALQAMNGKDSHSFLVAEDLFGEVAKLNGPRQQAALKLQQDALAKANSLNASAALAALTDGARQDLKRGEFRSARQKATQLLQSGGDPGPLSQEINEAEQARFSQLDTSLNQLKQRADGGAVQSLRDLQSQFQALADSGGPTANEARRDAASIPDTIAGVEARATLDHEEGAYQQALQRYHAIPNANDKSGLDASRSDFQSILNGGGHRAADAQKILAEIDSRVIALNAANQPANPTTAIQPADETPAVRAAVQRYVDAFDQRDVDALRQVWPTMTAQTYGGLKGAFGGASSIVLRITNERVELGADGATAVVNADITQNYTPKGEKTRVSMDHTVFHLVKSNGVWVIKDLK